MSFLEIALPCLARGWWVFPLQPRSKLPFKGSRGFKDASTVRTQIEAWGRAVPDANAGIATGPSGLVVLDPDGPEGQALLKAVARGDLPRTLVVKTGRLGGYHIYYAGTGIPSSQVKGEHLDVRGSTGYVLAPGCVHENGTIYTIVVDSPVVAVPTWVGPWVRSRGKGVVPAVSERPETRPHLPLPASFGQRSGGAATTAQRAMRALQEAEAQSWSPEAETRLRLALSAIPADIDGQTWASFGMALCDLRWGANGHDVGFELWDEWSKTSTGKGAGNGEYRGRADLAKRWRGFQEKNYQGARATVGSIFAAAQRKGWASEHTDQHANDVKAGQVNGVAALPAPIFSSAPRIVFPDTNKAGKPLATCRNARLAIRGLGIECRYDEFRNRCFLGGHSFDQRSSFEKTSGVLAGELTDNAVHELRSYVDTTYRFDPGTLPARDAAIQECLAHRHDPVLDYLDGLTWDRRARLAGWLSVYLGAADTAFNRAIGLLVLVAAVRRAREPGCKFDQIVVLEGTEGTLKSSALKILAGEWFSDQTLLGLNEQRQQEALEGVWLYEIADLTGHRNWEVERMKAFASRTHDRVRPAYGHFRVDQPRRCVLFATTNDDTYLKSQTGNRRFWPVRCGQIDLEALKRDRGQLWAEACAIEESGASLVLDRTLWTDARALQNERLEHDLWDDLLADTEKTAWAKLHSSMQPGGRGEWRVSTRDIIENILNLGAEKLSDTNAKRLAHSMRRLGWDGPKATRISTTDDGVAVKGYVKQVP
jgi:hypothetical protein